MRNSDKLVFSVVLLLLLGIVGLHLYGQNVFDEADFVSKSSQGDLLTGAVVGLNQEASLSSIGISTEGCFSYTTQNTCESNNCYWETHGEFSNCEPFSCFAADGTNQSYCESLNATYNLSFSCEWNSNLCDPLGGAFFGDGCDDYHNNSAGCYGTFFCEYNETGGSCNEPAGGFDDNGAGFENPSCGILNNNQEECLNVTGCSWDAGTSSCSGHEDDNGIACGDIVDSNLCASSTFLSTCCNWNGSSCKTSFDQSCYNNIPVLEAGSQFCEDTNVFTNETLCNQLAGSPFFMPCAFNQSGKSECHFNSNAFGDDSSFDEIGTELGCEAQGGVWKTEQFTAGGIIKTDSWCEFKFGVEHGGGNCDSACWACENDATSTSDAQSDCEGSALGYCEFTADSNAHNGYGWCSPKQDFIEAGGKSCDDDCGACEFLINPQASCGQSANGCVFAEDSDAPNGVGFCYGKSEKYCGNDCFSCYSQSECIAGNGGEGACAWDTVSNYCKPVGYSDEICFDGIDNDNDAKIDCDDSGCATNKFCGGEELGSTFGADCPSFGSDNTSCLAAGCVFLQDDFAAQFGEEGAGHCDFPFAQCFQHDENSTACDETSGCAYFTTPGGYCEVNMTLSDNCFPAQNQTACETTAGCEWNNGGGFGGGFGGGGWCEPVMFSQCFQNQTRQQSQALCESNVTVGSTSTQICTWGVDHFTGFEGCQPTCFSQTNDTCGTDMNGLCQVENGFCEPDAFGGKCFASDGNQTKCEGILNQTCTWFPDTLANNNVSNMSDAAGSSGNSSGWCNPKVDAAVISFMGDIEPTLLGDDPDSSTKSNSHDIEKVYIRSDFDRFVFGTSLYDQFNQSITCNGVPTYEGGAVGSGTKNHTFFWYVDADGDTSNGCDSRDNASVTGFEFSFKYQAKNIGGAATETKVAYQCVNSSWGAAPIPLTSNKQRMCDLIAGGMAGLDKTEMFKFKNLYNKSEDLRVYTTVGESVTNDSLVNDSAGPFFFSPHSIDFKFEDCADPGADSDGDGITASNDPDCVDFLKFGYVPNEIGFQCGDGIDNDADGLTDCDDQGCSFDAFYCGGSLVADPNDKTAPKIQWLNVETFPDSAFIMYDTNEPSNGTVTFYDSTNSTCKTANDTVRDIGLWDSYLPEYKMWHDGPLDAFSFNPEALQYKLQNATTYFYKTTVCDVSGNCATSACLNFTTKANLADCKGCTSTFNFPFTPPSGAAATDPLGNLKFTFELPDGTESELDSNAASGSQLNYSQTKNFDLVIQNPNATNGSFWQIKLINASITGKVSTGVQNFTGEDDVNFNATENGTFVGLGNTKCQELINTFRPKKLVIGIPGNITELWQCNENYENCTRKDSNATLKGYNTTGNYTEWEVPAEWGC